MSRHYYVPDVSKEVTYTARFEYCIDYYVNTKDNDKVDGEYQYWNFYSEWVRYQSAFDGTYAMEIAPKDYEHNLSHWSLNNNGGDSCEGGDEISGEDLIIKTQFLHMGIGRALELSVVDA